MERGIKAREIRAAVKECKEVVKANLMPLFDLVAKATIDIWTAWMNDLDGLKNLSLEDAPAKKIKATKRRREKAVAPRRNKRHRKPTQPAMHVTFFSPAL